MTLNKLNNLVRIGQLKREVGNQAEFDGLMISGRNRLDDAQNKTNTLESRFDLAYNAAHAFCLAVHVGMAGATDQAVAGKRK